MEDNLIFYFLAGLLGNEIARYLTRNDRKIKIPFFLLYSVCFTVIYSIAAAFLAVVYFINGTEICWKGVGVFSISVSLCIALSMYILDKIRCYRNSG